MQTTNPLPGMNPYLETAWPDVHNGLLWLIRESIAEQLPPDLRVRGEQDIEIGHEPPLQRFRPDVAIQERDGINTRGVWKTESDEAVAVAEPEVIEIEPLPHRWVEIRDRLGTLITVIEVLSPSNKEGSGRREYLEKQLDLLSGGVNLVEIDLLRGGQLCWSADVVRALQPSIGTRYLIMTSRAKRPTEREVYYCPLREPLPTIRVPLRVTDSDIPLALQPMIDRVYRIGRYWQVSDQQLPPPKLPEDDAAWINERLRAAGLM